MIKQFGPVYPDHSAIHVEDIRSLFEGKIVKAKIEIDSAKTIKMGVDLQRVAYFSPYLLVKVSGDEMGIICTQLPNRLKFSFLPGVYSFTKEKLEVSEPAGSIQGHLA